MAPSESRIGRNFENHIIGSYRLSCRASLDRQPGMAAQHWALQDGLPSGWNQENHFDTMSIRSENREKLWPRPSSKTPKFEIDLFSYSIQVVPLTT
jgi:hypothetical protein